ncbi:hypothetical protein MRX96_015628 [Rhipicephalus microplus]
MCRLAMLAVLLVAAFVTASSTQRGPQQCFFPPDRGPCRAFVPSFYFDSSSRTCRDFVYGGCQGNANRFKTRRQCLLSCS